MAVLAFSFMWLSWLFLGFFLIAYIHEGLGNTDAALDWLELAIEERDGWLIYLNSFPRFNSLRDEDRFRDILNRLHQPEDNL